MNKKISLKKNIVASYVSQIYIILVGILVIPFYIIEMGPEAYGLIGFYTMLQSIFAILDFGLTPTIGRETARYRAGIHSNIVYSQLLRTLHIIFIVIASVGGGLLILFSDTIAKNWLKVENLPIEEVVYSIYIMSFSVSLRWISGLYRGIITGNEQIVWLSNFNILIVTLRFLIVFLVMSIWGATPYVFFTYQFVVIVLEFFILFWKSNRLKPEISKNEKSQLSWSISPIKSYMNFALNVALSSTLWLVVTQIDKLTMSKLLTLENYGYFTMAVLVASGISKISGPISNPILIRMSKLKAENKEQEMINLYHKATQLITVIAGSVCIMLVVYADKILYIWTGNEEIVKSVSHVLAFYAVGYFLVVLGALPYYIQYSIGNIKLHVVGSILYGLLFLPLLWFMVNKYEIIGAGYAWLLINSIYFVIWTALVHNVYLPQFHLKWLINDIIKPLFYPIIWGIVSSFIFVELNKVLMIIKLLLVWLLMLAFFCINSQVLKEMRFYGKIKERLKLL